MSDRVKCSLCGKPAITRYVYHLGVVGAREAFQATFCGVCWAHLVPPPIARALWTVLGRPVGVAKGTD